MVRHIIKYAQHPQFVYHKVFEVNDFPHIWVIQRTFEGLEGNRFHFRVRAYPNLLE